MTESLPMRDPCPHVTRMQIIRAKLHGETEALQLMLEHADDCGRYCDMCERNLISCDCGGGELETE